MGQKVDNVAIVAYSFGAPFFVFSIAKFIIGLNNINGCPADSKIPEFMVEASCFACFVEVYLIVVVTRVSKTDEDKATAICVFVVQLLINMVIATTYVAKQYYYLVGGCNGADECCNKEFLKFALGAVSAEWILTSIMLGVFGIVYYQTDD